MKRDPYFKFVAAALVAGVLLAFVRPSSTTKAKKFHAATLGPATVSSAKR